MNKKFFLAAITLSLGGAYSLCATAQVKPEVLVKQRQAAMTLLVKYFRPLAGMAQGKAPFDAVVVVRNAGYLETLTKLPWDGFDPSTKDIKSKALPAIYSETAKFNEAKDRLLSEVAKLVAVNKGGVEAAVKAQIGAVGKACGNCHESFLEKE